MTTDEIIGRQMWELMKSYAAATSRVAELEAEVAKLKPAGDAQPAFEER